MVVKVGRKGDSSCKWDLRYQETSVFRDHACDDEDIKYVRNLGVISHNKQCLTWVDISSTGFRGLMNKGNVTNRRPDSIK